MNARQGIAGCVGERVEEKSCENLPECDILQEWTLWSRCSLQCNMDGQIGERSRTRECESYIREDPADRLCDGALSQTQFCNNFPCLRDVSVEATCVPINEEVNCGKKKGFIETTRECTVDEVNEGECSEGIIIESKLCDLAACERSRQRQRESTTQRVVLERNFVENLENARRNSAMSERPRLKASAGNGIITQYIGD